MNDRNVTSARPREARKILDDGKPRQATQAELRDAMALIAKHGIYLKDVPESFSPVWMLAGMYASAALVLCGAIEKEFGR